MKKIYERKNSIISIVSILVSFIIALISLGFSILQSIDSKNFQNAMTDRQERFEMEQKYQAAIPHLRISRNSDIYDTLITFTPQDKEGVINSRDSEYAFNTIIDFNFENVDDNIAYFSHIEYGGVAHELYNLNLTILKGEVISFSPNNKFISTALDMKMYIVLKTSYNQFFSYECYMNYGERKGDTRYYTVDAIGTPKPYNTDNEAYKYMISHPHLRDIVILPEGGIIF